MKETIICYDITCPRRLSFPAPWQALPAASGGPLHNDEDWDE